MIPDSHLQLRRHGFSARRRSSYRRRRFRQFVAYACREQPEKDIAMANASPKHNALV